MRAVILASLTAIMLAGSTLALQHEQDETTTGDTGAQDPAWWETGTEGDTGAASDGTCPPGYEEWSETDSGADTGTTGGTGENDTGVTDTSGTHPDTGATGDERSTVLCVPSGQAQSECPPGFEPWSDDTATTGEPGDAGMDGAAAEDDPFGTGTGGDTSGQDGTTTGQDGSMDQQDTTGAADGTATPSDDTAGNETAEPVGETGDERTVCVAQEETAGPIEPSEPVDPTQPDDAADPLQPEEPAPVEGPDQDTPGIGVLAALAVAGLAAFAIRRRRS